MKTGVRVKVIDRCGGWSLCSIVYGSSYPVHEVSTLWLPPSFSMELLEDTLRDALADMTSGDE